MLFFTLTQKDIFDLQCTLTGKSGPERYAFHLEIPKYFGRSQITMVGRNTFDLKVERLDDTKIYATLDQKLSNWPDRADLMSFDFNRLTGVAELDYLHQPTDAELKAEKHPFPGLLILDDFSKNGSCLKAKPVF
jgi:hypothetical protein